jgi:restriction system protein
MAIPDYQSLMSLVLSLMADNKTRSVKDVVAELSLLQSWSDEDLEELLPSGSQTIAHSRIGWAITYLQKAGLLSCPRESLVLLTAEGKGIAAKLSEDTSNNVLSTHPEIIEHYKCLDKNLSRSDRDLDTEFPDVLPDRNVDSDYQSHQLLLADSLLEFHTTDTEIPTRVEQILLTLLVRTGYLEDNLITDNNLTDEKVIDLFSNTHRDRYMVSHSTKRWQVIQRFANGLNKLPTNKRRSYGDYSEDVLKVVSQSTAKLIRLDLLGLARVMIDYNVDLPRL